MSLCYEIALHELTFVTHILCKWIGLCTQHFTTSSDMARLFLIINPIYRYHLLYLYGRDTTDMDNAPSDLLCLSLFAQISISTKLHSSYHSIYPFRFQFNKSNQFQANMLYIRQTAPCTCHIDI